MTGLHVQRVTDHRHGTIGYELTVTPSTGGAPASIVLSSEQWGAFVASGVASLQLPPDPPVFPGPPV